jgi:cell wall-associated NlpC family hydrolase
MPCLSDLIGLPYKTHGRDESGLDCFGLVWLIALRNGTPIEDPWYKGFSPELIKLADQMNVEKTEFKTGCIIEMEKEGRLHLGYSIDNERMIHATRNEGVIVEEIGKYPVKAYWAFKYC